GDADGRLQALREKVRALEFEPEALAAALAARARATTALEAARATTRAAEQTAAKATARAEAMATALADAEAQHARLAELGEDVRHLGRLAELLGTFRNELVGAVGPRLSRQADSLFAELTDHEYDELRVDPDTY